MTGTAQPSERDRTTGTFRPAGVTVLRPHPAISLVLHRRSAAVAATLLLLLAVAMTAAACFGQTYISPAEVWHTLRTGSGQYELVVLELRVPRIVLGALVGVALGLAGRSCRPSPGIRWPVRM
jgi:iron complex transport system permease protein